MNVSGCFGEVSEPNTHIEFWFHNPSDGLLEGEFTILTIVNRSMEHEPHPVYTNLSEKYQEVDIFQERWGLWIQFNLTIEPEGSVVFSESVDELWTGTEFSWSAEEPKNVTWMTESDVDIRMELKIWSVGGVCERLEIQEEFSPGSTPYPYSSPGCPELNPTPDSDAETI